MTHEGIVLIARIGLVLMLILATSLVRTFIGPSKRRGFIMSTGMLAGAAFGVALSYLVPSSLKMQESAVFAVCGIVLGWGVAWFFAKRIPRTAG